jgi:hypothetical protein
VQKLFDWLESTALAQAVGQSLPITAGLSAAHVIGFTLVMSAGLVWSLRAAGAVLANVPPPSIARPARRLLAAGLAISLLSGFALFAPRASSTAPSAIFQLKMTLVVLAASYQLVTSTAMLGKAASPAPWLRASGVLGLVLWISLAITACWFILFE